MLKQYIETGKIVSTHGIKGEVKVDPWANSPDFITEFDTFYTNDKGTESLNVLSSRVQKNQVLILFDGIDTVEKANSLRSTVLYINRDDVELQDGSHFICDLIDCNVFDSDTNALYGKIKDVFETGANLVWTIVDENNKEYLFPAVDVFIKNIDVENCVAYITPPKGIFDDDFNEV